MPGLALPTESQFRERDLDYDFAVSIAYLRRYMEPRSVF